MSTEVVAPPRLAHAVPGRLRVYLPEWSGDGRSPRRFESLLREMRGVQSVQANPLTGSVVIRYAAGETTPETLLEAVRTLGTDDPAEASPPAPPPPVLRERARVAKGPVRARIAVRGLDRDPRVAQRVVERLQRLPGVRARANTLTGRVLVEYDEHLTDLEDLVSNVADVELPGLPGEDYPAHPLDPAPLVQSATRTVGAALGLSLLGAQRLAGAERPLVTGSAPSYVSAFIGVAQAFPPLRGVVISLLGKTAAELVLSLPDIVLSALTGSPLSLVLSGTTALRLLTEVVARRAAWRGYEARIEDAAAAEPGVAIRLEAGERTPRTATVLEGFGTALGRDGLPYPVVPGGTVEAGARLSGGPFVMELQADAPFTPQPRPAPPAPTGYDRYQRGVGLASLAYAAVAAIVTRSPSRFLTGLLLVNPRPALIGRDSANLSAAARVLRGGVVIVRTRPDRHVTRPDALLLDGPRILTNGIELTGAVPLNGLCEAADVISLASGVTAAAGAPWGNPFPPAGAAPALEGAFDGTTASALIDDRRFMLRRDEAGGGIPEAEGHRRRGSYVLVLHREGDVQPVGLLTFRPKLAPGVTELVDACRRADVELALLPGGDPDAAREIARRAGMGLLPQDDVMGAIRLRQADGRQVAFVSDSACGAEAFAACDLGIGLSSGRSGRFPARADLLAPDLSAVAAIVEAGARREATVRDSIGLSLVSNVIGIVWGLRGQPGVENASRVVYVAALAAIADGWGRLRDGGRSRSAVTRLVDPRPERWGRQDIPQVLRALHTSEQGLTNAQAVGRRRILPPSARRNTLLVATVEQLRSPLIGILAAGAGLSLFLGSSLDFALIGATVLVNVLVGVWQERQAGQAAEALARLGSVNARVLRDGSIVTVPAGLVVSGDVLLLSPGDRVAADARLLESNGLEVDEASLTGESLPVAKAPMGGSDDSRIILEGSDVTTGTGRAVVFAVGAGTRLGATAAALAVEEDGQSPLGLRLGKLLGQFLPIAAGGGAIVIASGFLRGRPLLPQLAVGATIALAAVPEGLPLLAGMGEASVARRLAGRRALVRRLSAVEALGRVDVACTDKTGTLTEGKLALTLVAGADGEEAEVAPPAPNFGGARAPIDESGSRNETPTPPKLGAGGLSESLRHVLLTAALASPHPDAPDAAAHPTDMAVIRGAFQAGLEGEVRTERAVEVPFDPARAFHATVAQGRLCLKGAPEALAPRCARSRYDGNDGAVDDVGRQALLDQAQRLAERGLRVLMVAEAPASATPQDPQGITALGFVGISDPLRSGVPAAAQRCRDAGIRVIMITGDHPATARAIARQAGLLQDGEEVLTSAELTDLHNGDLARRLERTAVIARATPLDKLRIIESLQGHGHTVAMTGDGVNDAPALRLADVGVAMGQGGTEVARQAADVVLADDDFATLVESLVEGRGFWRNMRRALGLLLGGNLGELGLVVGATALGLPPPLNTRQILAMNLITDALPALAVATQKPEHRDLASLAREGTQALDKPLRNDVIRRGTVTLLPSLAGYAIMLGTGSLPLAQTVAFSTVVATQLAQTLDAGRAEGALTRPVLGAVGGSAVLLLASLTIPGLRSVLTLAALTPFGWMLVGGGAATAVVLARLSAGMVGDASAPPVRLSVAAPLRAALAAPRRLLLTGPAPNGFQRPADGMAPVSG